MSISCSAVAVDDAESFAGEARSAGDSLPEFAPVEVIALDVWTTPPRPALLRNPLRFAMWLLRIVIGGVSLVVLLSMLAAIPVLNLVALGMLLDAEGRVARSGRLRDGFPLLGVAGRLGTILLGLWAWMLPLRLLAFRRDEAAVVAPDGTAARNLEAVTIVVAVLVTIHLCLALAAGGRVSNFLRPWKNLRRFRQRLRDGNFWSVGRHQLVRLFHRLGWRRHFWLGLRGFAGAFLWLVIPTALLASSRASSGPSLLIVLLGGLLLIPVLWQLPFLQARFVAEQRFAVFREVQTIRRLSRQRPLLWTLTVVLTLAMTFPLYLGKIKLPPRDVAWLVTVIFVGTIYPARLLCGWVYFRVASRERSAGRRWIWFSRLLGFPLLLAYVVLLFLVPFVDEHGRLALFEHHAFLLPVPF